MDSNTKESVRRFMEWAYLETPGQKAEDGVWKHFNEVRELLKPMIGTMTYVGNFKFVWEEPTNAEGGRTSGNSGTVDLKIDQGD